MKVSALERSHDSLLQPASNRRFQRGKSLLYIPCLCALGGDGMSRKRRCARGAVRGCWSAPSLESAMANESLLSSKFCSVVLSAD